MSTFSLLSVLLPLIKSIDYRCNQIDCNQEFTFNSPTSATSFYCDVAGNCDNLLIYYAGSSALNVYCSGQDSCKGVKIFCGDWSPPIIDITNSIQCRIHCDSNVSPACVNVLFSCKGTGEIDQCWMGSTNDGYNIIDSTMECNIGNMNSQTCELSCFGTGCQNNDLLCHTNSHCDCSTGNCGQVTEYSDVTYSPTTTRRPTKQPTRNPTTVSPTTVSPTTVSPTTISPTTISPTTTEPTTASPSTALPTSASPTTVSPTTILPTTASPTTALPTTALPTRQPTTAPTTDSPTTSLPTTRPITAAKPSIKFLTAYEPTLNDENIKEIDTTISEDKQGENEKADNTLTTIFILIMFVCMGMIFCIIIMLCTYIYCRIIKRKSKLVRVPSVPSKNLSEKRHKRGAIEMEQIELPPQPQINDSNYFDTKRDPNTNKITGSDGDEDEDSASQIYMNGTGSFIIGSVVPTATGGGLLDNATTTGYNIHNDDNINNESNAGENQLENQLEGESDEVEIDDDMYIKNENNENTLDLLYK